MTKLRKLASFILAAIMILSVFTAFADDDPVVATFDGGKVLKSEVDELTVAYYYAYVSSMNYMYQLTGGSTYTGTEDDYKNAGQYIASYIAQIKVFYNKMIELGCEPFSDEYLAELKEEADNQYVQEMYNYIAYGYTEDAAYQTLLYEGCTPVSIYVSLIYNEISENIKAKLQIDETVTDEEIEEKYNALVEKQKSTYTKTPTSAETLINNGNTCYYVPEGLKYAKHILLIPDDEELMNEYTAALTAVATYENEIATVTASTYEPQYDAIVEKAILDEAKENLAASEKQVEELKNKLYEACTGDIDLIYAAIENGESFDALIEKYSEDTGSLIEPYKTKGYVVHKNSSNWDDAFKGAVDSLNAVGEISQPVVGSYGVHIVKYDSAPALGSPALEDVKDEIKATLLTERREAAYETEANAWMDGITLELTGESW